MQNQINNYFSCVFVAHIVMFYLTYPPHRNYISARYKFEWHFTPARSGKVKAH